MWSTAAAGLWFLLVVIWANPTTLPPTTTITPTVTNNTTAPTTANATVTNSTAADNATLDALVRAVFYISLGRENLA
jgi:hypothetical protein